jgi:hypothetical protein
MFYLTTAGEWQEGSLGNPATIALLSASVAMFYLTTAGEPECREGARERKETGKVCRNRALNAMMSQL